jgi:hypothetical protein
LAYLGMTNTLVLIRSDMDIDIHHCRMNEHRGLFAAQQPAKVREASPGPRSPRAEPAARHTVH